MYKRIFWLIPSNVWLSNVVAFVCCLGFYYQNAAKYAISRQQNAEVLVRTGWIWVVCSCRTIAAESLQILTYQTYKHKSNSSRRYRVLFVVFSSGLSSEIIDSNLPWEMHILKILEVVKCVQFLCGIRPRLLYFLVALSFGGLPGCKRPLYCLLLYLLCAMCFI